MVEVVQLPESRSDRRLGHDRFHASRQEASRNFSDGFSMVTTVLGGQLRVKETLAPMTELAPTVVSPPRTVAFE